MKTTIIMVRHGFSIFNELKRFTGNVDSPLNELGKKQAEKAAGYLKDFNIHKIYSSDLCRAYDTAELIAMHHKLEVIKDKKLREIYAGEWENKTFEYIASVYNEQYALWRNNINMCCPEGGETVKDFYKRIKEAVFDIIDENRGKTVCIVTHATPIRVMKSEAVKEYLKGMNNVGWCPNASINIFEYENGEFSLIEDGVTEFLNECITELPSNI